jgi:UDP-N-acetylmuramoyl-tripeptide--D-alanyl-D-alanine ligase
LPELMRHGPLWTPDAALAAMGGETNLGVASFAPITGISIDTRTLEPGDLFFAIRGDNQDGHAFVGKAFERGAAAAVVAHDSSALTGPVIRVDEPLAAMQRLGIAARARCTGTIFAVTGSVGKTSTKEALRACLGALGPTHAAEKSYNNHWGVPLTLARMPGDSRYGVFEIGMNHAGEITPLTRMVRPHIAIITTVGPVHIEFFPSEEAIADAKAEIFLGLEPGGTVILNRDNRHFDQLEQAARRVDARVISFGLSPAANARLIDAKADAVGTNVEALIGGRSIRYRLGMPGRHVVANSLAVLAAIDAAGLDLETAVQPLASLTAGAGRGERTLYTLPDGPVLLMDESYNANPASMRAAMAALGDVPRAPFRRRVAVIGDMRELGERSDALHRALVGPIAEAGVDLVVAVGPYMKALFDRLPAERQGLHTGLSDQAVEGLLNLVRPGDVVMIKGSLGTRMAPLVTALKSHLASLADTSDKASGH